MPNFKAFLQRLVTVSSPDPDIARRRRNLNIILMMLGCLVVLEVIITSPIIIKKGAAGDWLIIEASVFMLACIIIVYLINRYGSGKLAANIFLLALMTAISFSDTPEQLASGRSLFVFIIPIVISSLILPPTFTFFWATAGSVVISVYAISIGLFPNTPAIIGYFLVAAISWLSSSSLEDALRDLRLINTGLDQIVAERTEALTEAFNRERIEAGRNQAILNSIADGVIVFNTEHTAILANPALGDLTNTPHHSLAGINLRKFIQTNNLSPDYQKKITELVERPEKTESGFRIEWGEKFLSVGAARVQDPMTKENIGAVVVFRDVTREAELEKMKENFIAIVSHELRTPLNSIMGLTEMLKEAVYGALNDEQESITQRIIVNSARLLGMVGDLLDEAQIRAGKLSIKPKVFKTAVLLETLHHTMDKVVTDKDLTFTSNLDPNLPENIVGDPQRLEQILINLANNAVKFTEKGGIHAQIARVDSNRWKLEVTDTGIGIPENEIPFIFDAFRQVDKVTTRHYGGVGLGLSIVKQLTELMGGEINVKSAVGRGSSFTVLLPLESKQ